MNVAALAAKSDTVSDLSVDMRGLYLLAAPSTPAEVIELAAERLAAGETLSLEEVKAMIADVEEKSVEAARKHTAKLEAEHEMRIAAMREQFEAATVPRETIDAMIEKETRKLREQIETYEKAAKAKPIKQHPKSLEATAVPNNLKSLAEAFGKITPTEIVENYTRIVDLTGIADAANKRLHLDLHHALFIKDWIEPFLQLAREWDQCHAQP